jgi:hypothetical protein
VKTILVSAFCAVAVLTQTYGAFEATSVKANRSGELQSRGINIAGSRIVGENLPLRTLIQQAYGVLDFQIEGGPKWMDSNRFDIQASTGRSAAIQVSELGPLLQELVNRKMIGDGVTMGALAYRIAVRPMFVGRTVIDKTALHGFYDFTLEWEAGMTRNRRCCARFAKSSGCG